MGKHCVYCKTPLDSECVIDVCVRCGHGVWGEKMFKAIVKNMENARDSGSLMQGFVGNSDVPKEKNSKFKC